MLWVLSSRSPRRFPRGTMLASFPLLLACAPAASGPIHAALFANGGTLESAASPLAQFPGLVGVPNLDDDDGDGVADRDGVLSEVENDLAALELRVGEFPLTLVLEGDPDLVRIWQDEAVLLGGPGASTSAAFTAGVRTVALRLEFLEMNGRATLRVQEEGGVDLTLPLTSAPLLFNHHLQPATDVWAMDVGAGNAAFLASFRNALGDAFHTLEMRTYQRDVWVQDEIEFGSFTSPGAQMDFVFDTIRNGRGLRGSGLDDFPELELFGPEMGMGTWGSGRAKSYDYGGNLEVTPPMVVDGVEYPYGRLYYGADGDEAPNAEVRAMFEAQKLQRPFTVPTSWLYVGHIDEFQSFIPDPTAPRGFRFLIADTALAWSILEAMDPDTPLARWSLPRGSYEGHGIDDVRELLDDAALHALNEDIQRDHIDPALDIFIRELGLTTDEIVHIPALFEEVSGDQVAALIPGMTNLVVVQLEEQPVRVFLADPFLRADESDQGDDPMIQYVRSVIPSDIELYFVDDWSWYHMGLGEVHCGSNTLREPVGDWWVRGLSLLQEDL